MDPNTTLYISSSSFSSFLLIISIILIVLIATKVIVIPGLNSSSTTSFSGSSIVPTVRQRLDKLCPVDPLANGMINKGNMATRNDYLFNACTAAGTCDSIVPDTISGVLLNTLSSGGGGFCGGWNQPETTPKIVWDNSNKKWNVQG
jgi:hypothetical protein